MITWLENTKLKFWREFSQYYQYIDSFEVLNISEWTILLVMFILIVIFNT